MTKWTKRQKWFQLLFNWFQLFFNNLKGITDLCPPQTNWNQVLDANKANSRFGQQTKVQSSALLTPQAIDGEQSVFAANEQH